MYLYDPFSEDDILSPFNYQLCSQTLFVFQDYKTFQKSEKYL